jgi:hypothetical protein
MHKSHSTVASEKFRSVTLEIFGNAVWCQERRKILLNLHWSQYSIFNIKRIFKVASSCSKTCKLSITKLLWFTKLVFAVRYVLIESVAQAPVLLFLHDEIVWRSWNYISSMHGTLKTWFVYVEGFRIPKNRTNMNNDRYFSQLYRASWYYQSCLFTIWWTIQFLWNNIKIYIKIVPIFLGSITIMKELMIWAC